MAESTKKTKTTASKTTTKTSSAKKATATTKKTVTKTAAAIEPIVARDYAHLKELVTKAIDEQGPNCDLNYIDVSNVTSMEAIFFMTSFNGDVSKWNVSNVTTMASMFSDTPFKGDISKWKISKNAKR